MFAPPARSEKKASDVETATLNRRTLRFGVSVAAQLGFPGKRLAGGAAFGQGWYYELVGTSITAAEVRTLEDKLKELIAAKKGITRAKMPWKNATAYFEEHKLTSSKALLQSRVSAEVDMWECDGVRRLALFPLHESLGALAEVPVNLTHTGKGFVASYVKDWVPQSSLEQSFTDHGVFGASHGITCIGELNVLKGVGRERKDFTLACEFRQEAKLGEIASTIAQRAQSGSPVKIICIAGPTSSGKTTFANKLCLHLKNRGLHALPLFVDHYYLPLDRQPKYKTRQQRSDVDYDSIESMDVDLVGQHLNALVRGEAVLTPVYDMVSGYRKEPGKQFDGLKENGILVIEGIHALNPSYTDAVERSKLFKIYISPLSALQVDDCNKIKTTDHRLLRRMSRDYLFRGHSAAKTLSMWDNVRKGEGTWIFPHQNDVDFVMNSAAEYEIPVLKTLVEPLLRAVTPEEPEFDRARDLLQLLDMFATWPPDLAPKSALLREFIGDGDFDEH